VERAAVLPALQTPPAAAPENNPTVLQAALAVRQKEEEAKFARLSWLPTIRASGSFSLSGEHYPLTRHNWSVGISVEFSSPWFQSKLAGSTGYEGWTDQNARLSGSLTPVPDPAAHLSARSAVLALSLEREKYQTTIVQLGRAVSNAAALCALAEQKRALSVEAKKLVKEKLKLAWLKHDIGQITSLELMEAQNECIAKEIQAVESAIALLNAERNLEKLMKN
jgi:outer membrane protein TolC